MKNKSIVSEGREIALAVNMIQLGARLQLLEAETHQSRERLLKLYKEVKGVSPPKGMLPFSTDWFMTWQPNIHASLFMSFFSFFKQNTGLNQLDCIVKAFKLYQEHVQTHEMEEVLSRTRAWTLVRFFDAKLLQHTKCTCCGGHFVAHAYDPKASYDCGLCNICPLQPIRPRLPQRLFHKGCHLRRWCRLDAHFSFPVWLSGFCSS